MADGEDKESKTEEPTEKKLREAAEKGQLPQSRETALLFSFAAILVFTMFFAEDAAVKLAAFLSAFLERPEDWPLETGRDVETLMSGLTVAAGKLTGLILVFLAAAGVVAGLIQHSPSVVTERIRPQWSRVSPAAGWNRLFGAAGLVEFGKSLAKLAFALVVVFFALRGTKEELLSGLVSHPDSFAQVIRDVLVRILVSVTLVMGAIAGADFVWARIKWKRDLRMSKQEIKDEMKQAEGDPIVKGRIRSLQRDRARKRMMAAVPRATLVIANPTHFAIALRYVREENEAPVVLAKGQDLLALKIRALAAEHEIPVFEDVALARSMYKQVSVDSVIPPQFYAAVAELVRIVYARNTPRKTAGPGSTS